LALLFCFFVSHILLSSDVSFHEYPGCIAKATATMTMFDLGRPTEGNTDTMQVGHTVVLTENDVLLGRTG
jgi:hypothetical protein